jgi:hypothetical protein
MATMTTALSRNRESTDPALPTLGDALDVRRAEVAILERLQWRGARLVSADVLAHKRGRRSVIEYRFEVPGCGEVAILGKIRANRFGNSGYRQLLSLWQAGFQAESADGISVPEPLATVPSLRMWLQRKVRGTVSTALLTGPGALSVVESVAAAVHKLHASRVTPERRHTIDDEMRILVRCLHETAAQRPDISTRVHRLIDHCDRLAASLPVPTWCGSHRDFYSDQVLVSEDRVHLIDFDLFCEADPGLDVGNFIGHVTELAIRLHRSPVALKPVERRFEDAFAALAGEAVRWPVRVYAALTLARHVYLSGRFTDRAHLTTEILEAAEAQVEALKWQGGMT